MRRVRHSIARGAIHYLHAGIVRSSADERKSYFQSRPRDWLFLPLSHFFLHGNPELVQRRFGANDREVFPRVVHGGDTRQQSVANALAQVDATTEIVLVHDAVRPFVTPAQLDRVIAEARTRGAAILGIPAIDTVKEVKRASLPEDVALITATVPRERIVLAQTPQAFSYPLLRDAFRKAQQDGVTASDEAALVERFGHDVFVVLGSERNFKITRPADMDLARFYLEQERRTK